MKGFQKSSQFRIHNCAIVHISKILSMFSSVMKNNELKTDLVQGTCLSTQGHQVGRGWRISSHWCDRKEWFWSKKILAMVCSCCHIDAIAASTKSKEKQIQFKKNNASNTYRHEYEPADHVLIMVSRDAV